jgi:hypothetical protein
MENTAKSGLFAVHKIVSDTRKESMGTRRRDTKLMIYRLIMVKHENCLDPNFLFKMGWIKPKTISPYCPFKGKVEILINISLCTVNA